MPTQPFVRSPKCTLPSRPPVMPPSRPMYWAKMRARLDAADDVRGEVAVQDAEAVLRGHRPRGPGRDGLLAEAVVEASRGPCPGGRASSRAPRCRASSASRAAARRGPRWSGAPIRPAGPPARSRTGRFGRHVACSLSDSGALRDPPAARSSLGARAGSPRGRGQGYLCNGWSGRSESVVAHAHALAAARRLAVARVRRADARRGGRARRCCRSPGDGPGRGRRACCSRASRTCSPSRRWRRWPARCCAAAAPTCRASIAAATTRARRCSGVRRGGPRGRADPPAGAWRRSERPRARARRRARLRRSAQEPAYAPGHRARRRRAARGRPLPRLRPGPGPEALAVPVSSTPTSARRA